MHNDFCKIKKNGMIWLCQSLKLVLATSRKLVISLSTCGNTKPNNCSPVAAPPPHPASGLWAQWVASSRMKKEKDSSTWFHLSKMQQNLEWQNAEQYQGPGLEGKDELRRSMRNFSGVMERVCILIMAMASQVYITVIILYQFVHFKMNVAYYP